LLRNPQGSAPNDDDNNDGDGGNDDDSNDDDGNEDDGDDNDGDGDDEDMNENSDDEAKNSDMNKSGLSFPSDMNTTDFYNGHRYTGGEFDFHNDHNDIYEEETMPPVFVESQVMRMCLLY